MSAQKKSPRTAAPSVAQDGDAPVALPSPTAREVEVERQDVIKEVMALVVHDLASPLLVLQCASEVLSTDPKKALREDFAPMLREATERAVELVDILKSYMRGGDASPLDQVRFSDAMHDASRLLKMKQLLNSYEGVNQVEIFVAPELMPLNLAISRPDLMHVLLNIVGNGYKAAQETSAEPRVSIELGISGPDESVILISNNGSGFSPELFAALTGEGATARSGSMGLKLTRRLIARKGGSLVVSPRPRLGEGTTFEIRLPHFKELTDAAAA